MNWSTVNYLFAAYLQTSEAGANKITKVEKLRPGKAKFYFDLTEARAIELQMRFHDSICSEFEDLRKKTISLAYS
jgi:hypothetical protein